MSAIDPQPRLKPLFTKIFLDHPASVDESYFQHMRFAFAFAVMLSIAAGAAFVHAVVPALCKTTASTILRRLHARLSNRHAQ